MPRPLHSLLIDPCFPVGHIVTFQISWKLMSLSIEPNKKQEGRAPLIQGGGALLIARSVAPPDLLLPGTIARQGDSN